MNRKYCNNKLNCNKNHKLKKIEKINPPLHNKIKPKEKQT